MILIFRYCLLIFLIGFHTPGYAQWEKVEARTHLEQGFQARVEKGQSFYFCRDQNTNFGFTNTKTGCQLIYGSTMHLQNYEILMDLGHNLGWKQVKHSNIPIGAFDAGRAPLLGEKYLCLKKRGRAYYQGMVLEKQCHYRFKGQVSQSKNFQILTNLWAKTTKIPLDLPPSGKDASGDRYVCRVWHHGTYIPGTIGRGERMCKFIGGDGYEMINVDNYEVQLYLEHRWVRKKTQSIFKQAVVAGDQSPYFICRAQVLENLYIGKIKKGEDYCMVAIGGGHLSLNDYQLQITR